MRLGFICFASVLLLACDRGNTDIGDLPVDSESGGETGGETGTETGSPTTGVDCSGENCLDGCCEGFGCNFMNVCVPCSKAGEHLDIDGAGCCEGLTATPNGLCYAPTAGCAGLDSDAHPFGSDLYVDDCAPQACLNGNALVLDDDPGLQCAGPGGSSECAATGGALQQYVYESEALRLTLAFDAAILDGYSTESFNQHFDSAAGQLVVPGANVPLTAFVETGTVSPLTYADGRLQFTISVPLDNPFVIIQSDAEDCISDDIVGECACYYEDLGTFDVVVDLAIEAP